MVEGFVVVDLGFGDSGKGTITDTLVRELGAKWVVRFNGGAQAGHAVVTDDTEHIFSQFGAGTLVPGVRTFLSRFMLIHPGGLLEEARVLETKGVQEALSRVVIDPEAKVITPFHQAANRLRELLRGDERHGSCGLGVGETMHHSLEHPAETVLASDFLSETVLKRKLLFIQKRYWAEFAPHRQKLIQDPIGAEEFGILESPESAQSFLEQTKNLIPCLSPERPQGVVLFEGAQGVLLDEWRGFHPHTTWSTCTFDNALELIEEWGGIAFRIGVLRSYATRHGAGPFPTEDPSLQLSEPHNSWGPWQHGFRNGWLDLVLIRYAIEACGGIDGLALTHLDRMTTGWKVATRYQECEQLELGPFMDLGYQEKLGRNLLQVKPIFEEVSSERELTKRLSELAPVLIESRGPKASDKSILTNALSLRKCKAQRTDNSKGCAEARN